MLSPEQRRHLHGQWGRAPDRQSAWRLRSSAYLWLPAAELPVTAEHLRQHFALLATLRLDPKVCLVTCFQFLYVYIIFYLCHFLNLKRFIKVMVVRKPVGPTGNRTQKPVIEYEVVTLPNLLRESRTDLMPSHC